MRKSVCIFKVMNKIKVFIDEKKKMKNVKKKLKNLKVKKNK